MKSSAILGLAALSAVSASPLQKRAAASSNTTAINDTVILNYALTLEHLENAFYQGALEKFDEAAFKAAGLPDYARGRFQEVADHEMAHVAFLSKALGENATKPCEYNFTYTDPVSFAALSQVLEGVGVSAYIGAAGSITNPEYLTAAASVLATEARHAAWVAGAVNQIQPWSGAFDVPLNFSEVYTLASAFIVSCPSTNPTLPVKAFANVSYEPATAKPGENVTLTFEGSGQTGLSAVFLTGLAQEVVPVGNDSMITIPANLNGTVYLVIGKGDDAAKGIVNDTTTVAGVAVFSFPFGPDGKLL